METLPPAQRQLFRTLEPFILASASPRRRRLLQSLGLEFDIIVSGVDEVQGGADSPSEMVLGWARDKARTVAAIHRECWVLAADTIVVVAGTILGKPVDTEDARHMLAQLSDRKHEVITAICLRHEQNRHEEAESVLTQVRFKKLSTAEIDAYVASGEPLDKAGAYGIQGLGGCLVRSINGSYSNVVGLPLCESIEHLAAHGIITPR
ncbi:MAG TPA: septum formation inhibitor Maf [Syntrophobacteraceae bacterium]|nr:septum formation inhibitor Maf [Syntrophobacteraceae bacterium]HBD09949.1 septum formation inhibitor Maf [Syntrophobacteraceae bacterium]HBZ56308.1 septum formation inhibitor Maf [Syntrophobacteraceae bacterium]